ncbi:hypothetical protein ACWF94_08360 [Streptomyces sp. NPDC055078]
MRVKVSEILDADTRAVSFTGPTGTAWAYWQGPEVRQGYTYDVELDSPGVVTSWTVSSDSDVVEGAFAEGRVTLRGPIQSLGEDGVAEIRIAQDIVLIEVDPAIPEVPVGAWVEFVVPSISLYPYSL